MKKSKKFLLPFSLVLLLVIAGMFYMKSIVSHADTIPSDSIKSQLETMYNGKVSDLLLNDDIYGATLTRAGSVYSVRVDGETGKVISMILKEPSKELVSKQKEDAEKADKNKDEPSVGKTEEVPAQPVPEEPKPQPEAPKPAPAQPKPQPKPAPKPAPKSQQQEQQKNHQQNQYNNHNHQNNRHENKPAQQNTVIISKQQAIKIALAQLNGEVDDVDFVQTSEGGYYLIEIEIDVEDGPDEATYQIHAISGKIMSVTRDD
ncbi:PepSY domain-containing protein [Sporosarcina jeotgali]|uniref:PepSY domain-containing protein n=1 Tax=Sporosarcina jeotgali TaxID=3020056 RepID=A0ABZ0KWK5_9BACL|nr:PepSY domain-containing protein [Sporosarcina sp. B2O-1]WOV84533.1 PepSY domain-containing protein [Sporosarcina sp. B2O-1]